MGGLILFIAALLLGFQVLGALPAARDTSFTTAAMDGLPNASVLLPNGKILIGGNFTTVGGNPRPGLARLNSDGSVDTAFAPPIASTSTFGKPIVNDLALLPDGKILAAGAISFRTTGSIARTNIIRFNADGSLDAAFDAKDLQSFLGMAVQPDGKVVLGIASPTLGFRPVRINADGSPDSSFAFGGAYPTVLIAQQLFAQSDGKLLGLAGDNDPSRNGGALLFRMLPSGATDPTFKFTSPPNTVMDDSTIAIGADGRILVGFYEAGGSGNPVITATDMNGVRDPNFTFAGPPNNQRLYPVPAAFLPDGGAVCVRNPTAGDRRYTFFYLSPKGALLGSREMANAASDQGVVGLGTLRARAFAMQPDGRMLFAAAFLDGVQNTFGMFRLPAPPTPTPPVITQQPVSANIGAGEGLFLSVGANSELPLRFQWFHSGTNMPAQTNQTLNLGSTSTERAGDFYVVVSNAFFGVTSQVASVTVRAPLPLVMQSQPQGGTVRLSQPWSLNAQCQTDVPTGYQWYKNGQPLPTSKGQGFGSASLFLVAGDASRGGDYFVVFTNDFGGAVTSAVAHLDVIMPGPPQITAQPRDQSIYGSQPVLLSVVGVADGVLQYQWRRNGTNLTPTADTPSTTGPNLTVQAQNTNRFGDYSVVLTVTPGGSATSQIAHVTLLPPGPPVIITQPLSLSLPFGGITNLTVGFNGEAPLSVHWFRGSSNLQNQAYASLISASSNLLQVAAVPYLAGDYRAVVSNRFGAVTTEVAKVVIQAPSLAEIKRQPTNTVVGIGEFNTVLLSNGLITTNCCGSIETTHILALTPTASTVPLNVTSTWHLAIGASNRFYVGAAGGLVTMTNTWGFVPGASAFTAFLLTNFPSAGIVSRFESLDDGRYSLMPIAGASSAALQNGTLRVLGPRRPATNIFSVDIVSSNSVLVTWMKDGSPVVLNSRTAPSSFSIVEEALGAAPSGGVNRRYKLIASDVKPADAGRYWVAITNYVSNPDRSPGSTPTLIYDGGISEPATLTVKGYGESEPPEIVAAQDIGNANSLDEPTALAVTPQGATWLALRSTVFGGATSTANGLLNRDASGATNAFSLQVAETANAGTLGTIKAVVSDGADGAVIAGDGAPGTLDPWFLRRVKPITLLSGTNLIKTFTNLWTRRITGPFSNDVQNLAVPHSADVVGMVAVPDGVIVAGHFTGRPRFGSSLVITNPALPFFTARVGGVQLTNAFELVTGRTDISSKDIYVARYNLDGDLIWVRSFGGVNSEDLTSISLDKDGNLFLSGAFKTQTSFGAISLESTKVPNQNLYAADGFVAKLDINAQPIWVKPFGGIRDFATADAMVTSATPDGSGGAFFSANRTSGVVAIRPGMVVGQRYLARLNADGDLLWTQDINTGTGARLLTDGAGNVLLTEAILGNAATTPVSLGASTLASNVGSGGMAALFSPSGTLVWQRVLDEKLGYADDYRSFSPLLSAQGASGDFVIAGRIVGGTQGSAGRTSGQRFDSWEFFTTNTASANSSDIMVLRLADRFVPRPIRLTTTPVNTTGLLQSSVTLEARADGYPTPSYQWLRNGVVIPGATNRTLAFPELARTNAGSYAVVLSNAGGSTTNAPVSLATELPTSMKGWNLVTATTNYLGVPSAVALDDAGDIYLTHTELGTGAAYYLERFNADGTFAWRFSEPTTVGPAVGYTLNPKFSPKVTPAGDVFVAGRVAFSRFSSGALDGNFVGRLNPLTGRFLWVTNGIGLPTTQVVAIEPTSDSGLRVIMSDRVQHRFDAAGVRVGGSTLAAAPTTLNGLNSATAFTRDGGFYFYANRVEALNLGTTNLPALSVAAGAAQTWILARFDAAGALQWFRSYGGAIPGAADPLRLAVDANDNAVIAGSFGIGNQTNFRFAFGTNQLSGFGYAAKVSGSGDLMWAKSWFLHVDDARLAADGSIFLGGWFRTSPTTPKADRAIAFGPHKVFASYTHDAFVAKLTPDGQEEFIRQGGSPDFATFDNARDYYLDVNKSGAIVTAGFTLALPAAAAVDFGDIRYTWPNLQPYNFGNLFGTLSTFYIARLQPGGSDPAPAAAVTFEPPAPGGTTLRLNWPAGMTLQRRLSLTDGIWENVIVQPPFDVDVRKTLEGYFRLVR